MLDSCTLNAVISSIKNKKILVIGDIIRDCYITGPVERLSPEAPVPVLKIEKRTYSLGGAANAAENLVSFGVKTFICGALGCDEQGIQSLKELERKGINTSAVVTLSERPTSVKTRIIAHNQQLLRLDEENISPLSPENEQEIFSKLEKLIPEMDGVIISDYGKGVVTPLLVTKVVELTSASAIKVTVDPKGGDYSKYKGVFALTPNRNEAEEASSGTSHDLAIISEELMADSSCEILLITLGPEGMYLSEQNKKPVHIKSYAREVFDVTGAGDTVIALFSASLFAGIDRVWAADFANIAAAVVVGKKGSAVTSPEEVVSSVSPYSFLAERKIRTCEEMSSLCKKIREQGQKIVFTNGCFDLLHVGHIKYLASAREKGDILVVGLNSDLSVKRLKGENRPLLSEKERSSILAALECVDFVVIFDDNTPLNLIGSILPDVLVKGGDYAPDEVVGKEVVEQNGGRVEIIPFVDGFSTSRIIEDIRKKF